jgi:hypothetical protein
MDETQGADIASLARRVLWNPFLSLGCLSESLRRRNWSHDRLDDAASLAPPGEPSLFPPFLSPVEFPVSDVRWLFWPAPL